MISLWYDLMIVKIVIYVVICDVVLWVLDIVLCDIEVVGIVINIDFLIVLIWYLGFVVGQVDIGLIVCDIVDLIYFVNVDLCDFVLVVLGLVGLD